MTLLTSISVPTYNANLTIEISGGTSTVFIGANGAGKTRLGVYFDQGLSNANIEVHRIAAHRSLNLNPNVIPPSFEIATNTLFYGSGNGSHQHKWGSRYNGKPETVLLNDFDQLVAALYAENNDVSIAYRNHCIKHPEERGFTPPPAKIDRLKIIWEKLLPHRELVVLSGNIKTTTQDGSEYSASDMSDGERVIFYLIAQALLAKPNSLLIFDEPELHINKSILAKLWDEIESARSDCAFLYITHDIEFAASRHAATKYALRRYRKQPTPAWDIELIPEGAELPEDVVAGIVGSRRPVLIVEGDAGSLDISLYRRIYDTFTVIPVGSCELVIHTVTSFAARPDLHRIGCAGLIDADGRTGEEISNLKSKGIYCLPVSEIENICLLPTVFLAVAKALQFSEQDGHARLEELRSIVLAKATQQSDAICLRHTKRRIDAEMKKIGLSRADIHSLEEDFTTAVSNINASRIFTDTKANLTKAINNRDHEEVLRLYDNKGLFAEAAKQLGSVDKVA